VTATDTVTSSITGNVGLTVSPAAASRFILSAPPLTIAGSAFSVTVLAFDAFNNLATGYGGTVHFTSSDGQASLPADYNFAGDQGLHTFTNAVTLNTPGSQTVTATDTGNSSITGTASVDVASATAAVSLSVVASSSTTAGAPLSVTVTALNTFGNVATGYGGTIHFTSSDGQAGLPADYTFGAGDQGVHTFTVTLKTAGGQTVTATDTGNGSLAGFTDVTVSPAAASQFTLSAPAGATAGAAFSVTVVAFDAFNNIATGYGGTVHFTSSDGLAGLPADYTFGAGDHGVHTFTNAVTLNTTGSQTVTATDTVTSSITGTASVNVTAAQAAVSFRVVASSSTTAGSPFTVTVTALDSLGHAATGYAGTVHFTSSDGRALLPADYTFGAGDRGVHTFINGVELVKAGKQTVTAADTSNSTITGSHTVKVNPGAATHFKVTAPHSSVSGASFSITITALDAFGNIATGYVGLVQITSSDGSATLPPELQFSFGDKGKLSTSTDVTLRTVGRQTITLTDTVNGSINGTATVKVTAAAADLFAPGGSSPGDTGQSAAMLDAFFAAEWLTDDGVYGGGTRSRKGS
jgi:hypothetical protein